MQERTSGKQQQAGTAPAQVWLRLSDGIEYAGLNKSANGDAADLKS
jgi:hypothetical protein